MVAKFITYETYAGLLHNLMRPLKETLLLVQKSQTGVVDRKNVKLGWETEKIQTGMGDRNKDKMTGCRRH